MKNFSFLYLFFVMFACEEQQTNQIMIDAQVNVDQKLNNNPYVDPDMGLTPWREILNGTYLVSVNYPMFSNYTSHENILFYLDIQFDLNDLPSSMIQVYSLGCDDLMQNQNDGNTTNTITQDQIQRSASGIRLNLGKFVFRTDTSCIQQEFSLRDLTLDINSVARLQEEVICGFVEGVLYDTTATPQDTMLDSNAKFKATRIMSSEITTNHVQSLNNASCLP